MEIWLIFAVTSAFFSGLAGFILKVIAKNGASSELHVWYSAVFSIILLTPAAFYLSGPDHLLPALIGFSVLTGLIASVSIVFKVYALRYIDTTIYFPLFKIASPMIAIIIGVTLFKESFTTTEWIGLIISLLIPLLLITKIENDRQNNLTMGIMLVLFTGALASVVASLNKFITDTYTDIVWIAVFSSVGVLLGSSVLTLHKHGYTKFAHTITTHSNKSTILLGLTRAIIINGAFLSLLYSFYKGGALGIVYTITSMYILIPIILAILFYGEHWNLRKAAAVTLSIVALGFFV